MGQVNRSTRPAKKRLSRLPQDKRSQPGQGFSVDEKSSDKALSPDEVANMTLKKFSKSKLSLVVYSKLLGENIRFVSDELIYQERQEGKEVVYSVEELELLLGKSPEELKEIHRVKKEFPSSMVIE